MRDGEREREAPPSHSRSLSWRAFPYFLFPAHFERGRNAADEMCHRHRGRRFVYGPREITFAQEICIAANDDGSSLSRLNSLPLRPPQSSGPEESVCAMRPTTSGMIKDVAGLMHLLCSECASVPLPSRCALCFLSRQRKRTINFSRRHCRQQSDRRPSRGRKDGQKDRGNGKGGREELLFQKDPHAHATQAFWRVAVIS